VTAIEPTPVRSARFVGLVFALLIAVGAMAMAASLLVGRATLGDLELRDTLIALRLGRFLAAFMAGAALAVGGVMVQGLFRNPLASPEILGTTAGASFGGHAMLIAFEGATAGSALSGLSPQMLLPVGCVLGALLALLFLVWIARASVNLVVILLSGFLLSALFLSLNGFLTSLAQERWELARALVAISLGDVSGAGFTQISMAAPMLLAGIVAAWLWGRSLDVMLSGEDEARALGVDTNSLRQWMVVWTALLTGAAVALGGTIGFVGLIVPHALRPLLGERHRLLVPGAALLGGAFLAACDVLTRVLPSKSEIPLGVITGLIGAPVFMIILLRRHRSFHLG